VRAGYSTTRYACLEFSPTSSELSGSEDRTNLIIGLTVGLALLVIIIIVIIIIVCVVKRRRKRGQTDTSMSYSNLRVENPHYSDISTTSSAPGTTRSFMFGNEHLSDKPVESVSVEQYWSHALLRRRRNILWLDCCNALFVVQVDVRQRRIGRRVDGIGREIQKTGSVVKCNWHYCQLKWPP